MVRSIFIAIKESSSCCFHTSVVNLYFVPIKVKCHHHYHMQYIIIIIIFGRFFLLLKMGFIGRAGGRGGLAEGVTLIYKSFI